jgi:two-component system response regulator MtrA
VSAQVLVAEHDPAVAELIRRYLVKEGWQVHGVATAGETSAALATSRAAAIVLDLTMPGLDAREIRKLIRGRPGASGGQVICLTAGEAPRAMYGLRPKDIGVSQDACLARPFGPRTLVSRVRTLVRAAQAARALADGMPPGAAAVHTAGRLRLEAAGSRATLDGVDLALTGTEFDVLSHLVRSAGRAVRRDALRHAIWGADGAATDRIVDVYIAQLRAKLGHDNGIRTVRGIGYVMDPAAVAAGVHTSGQNAPDTIEGAGHPIRGDSGTA